MRQNNDKAQFWRANPKCSTASEWAHLLHEVKNLKTRTSVKSTRIYHQSLWHQVNWASATCKIIIILSLLLLKVAAMQNGIYWKVRSIWGRCKITPEVVEMLAVILRSFHQRLRQHPGSIEKGKGIWHKHLSWLINKLISWRMNKQPSTYK